MDYKFTVFTPCYNGEKTIHRVFKSMNAQTTLIGNGLSSMTDQPIIVIASLKN